MIASIHELAGRLGPSGLTAVGVLVLAVSIAALGHAGLVAPDYERLIASPHAPPSAAQWLGADALGRDVWARTLRAAEASMITGVVAAMLGVVVGAGLGVWSGLVGGRVERGTLVGVQIIGAIPPLLVIIGLAALLEPGFGSSAIAIACVQWVGVYRVSRAEAQRLAATGYLQAAQAMGASWWWRMRHHVAGHLAPLLATSFALHLAYAIKAAAVLGFLGLSPSEVPSWGRMLAESSSELSRGIWWTTLAAAVPLTAVVLAAQQLADRLESVGSAREQSG